MSFKESPRFPEDISYGSSGGPGYDTGLAVSASGYEYRNQNWVSTRHIYEASHGLKNAEQLKVLLAFFHNVKGRAVGFRYKDWADFSVTTTDGYVGSGVGDGTPGPMQLNKAYISGSDTTLRAIRKPTASPAPSVYRAGVLKTLTTHYTLDLATGLLTWVNDASTTANSITVGATTQVVLASNPGTLTAGHKLYLTGFTGTDAALINNLAHTINSVTGAGPYTFTLSTNTAGKTITLGSGLGKKYPQVSEVLAWAGEFDVPCRFDTDRMNVNIENYGSYQWGQIPVVEVRV